MLRLVGNYGNYRVKFFSREMERIYFFHKRAINVDGYFNAPPFSFSFFQHKLAHAHTVN